MTVLTKKQSRLVHYNRIIANNAAKFKPGCVLTRKEFASLFMIPSIHNTGTFQDIHRSNLKLVSAQTEINMLMRENGLYLRSRDYYSEFVVAQKVGTKSAIARYSSEVDISRHCVSRLEMGLAKNVKQNTWGQYHQLSLTDIANLGTASPTQRHTSTIKRLKTY